MVHQIILPAIMSDVMAGVRLAVGVAGRSRSSRIFGRHEWFGIRDK